MSCEHQPDDDYCDECIWIEDQREERRRIERENRKATQEPGETDGK